MPSGQSNGGNSSVESPSSQMCLGWCEVDQNYYRTDDMQHGREQVTRLTAVK